MTVNKSPEVINKMFDSISSDYNFMNDVMSFGLHKIIKEQCIKLLCIQDGFNIVDLCSGTGDLAMLIKKHYPKTHVTGVDFSEKMIEKANRYKEILCTKRHSDGFSPKEFNINFLQGDATNLPFADNSFDVVTMGFGLRNIYNAEKAVEEVFRILKPNGLFMHVDFGEKNFFSSIFNIIALIVAKIHSRNFSAYSYLIKSKKEFLTPDDLIKDFENKGFKLVQRKDFIFKVISCQIMTK